MTAIEYISLTLQEPYNSELDYMAMAKTLLTEVERLDGLVTFLQDQVSDLRIDVRNLEDNWNG